MFINIKLIRKTTNFFIDLIYKTPFKNPFLWTVSRIPIGFLSNHFWINSPDYYLKSFEDFFNKMEKAAISFKGKDILEIGSGSSFGWGYLFLVLGVNSYTSSDIVRSANMSARAIETELSLIKLVEQKYKKRILGKYIVFKNKHINSLTNKLRFQVLDITAKDLKVRRQYDIIISNAVFEHLPKKSVPKAINNMCQLLKNNGYMLHQIDLRDHYNFHQPFNFYAYSESQWKRLTNLGYFYTNRVRPGDYISLFTKNDFKVTYKYYDIAKVNIEKTRKKAHPSFPKYLGKDLATIGLTVALRKIK